VWLRLNAKGQTQNPGEGYRVTSFPDGLNGSVVPNRPQTADTLHITDYTIRNIEVMNAA
jgi:hypothetical protein